MTKRKKRAVKNYKNGKNTVGKTKRKGNRKLIAILLTIVILFELLVFLSGYFAGVKVAEKKQGIESLQTTEPAKNTEMPNETSSGPEEIAERILKDMSVEEMVYQMMFVTPEAITKIGTAISAGETTKAAIEKYPVGGLVYFAQNLENRDQTIEMLKNTQSYSKIPLFMAVDEEGGRVSRLGANPAMGTTKHPDMRSIGDGGDVEKAYEIGKTLATDLKGLGFNVDFAPVADVIINEGNTEIGDRSFGTDSETVAGMVERLVCGLEENGVSSSLKHFPGHGSTYNNSHSGYSESQRTLDELRENELIPFKRGADAGADFVMVSHMTPINATEEKVPCSVSKEIITDLLLGELGYKGIVITDSFSMGAITEMYSPAEAAVKAVNAGVDMILMPRDMEGTHAAIVSAVRDGSISEERIKISVRKILTLKAEKGMLK